MPFCHDNIKNDKNEGRSFNNDNNDSSSSSSSSSERRTTIGGFGTSQLPLNASNGTRVAFGKSTPSPVSNYPPAAPFSFGETTNPNPKSTLPPFPFAASSTTAPKATPPPSILPIGTKVYAQWRREGGSQYAGVIAAVNSDGTYDIQYDDGDKDCQVSKSRVSLTRNDTPSLSSRLFRDMLTLSSGIGIKSKI
jgi:hypothetical protein